MSRISIRMDDSLRKEADSVLEQLGLNMSTAVTVFMKQVVRQGALPFAVSLESSRAKENTRRDSLNALLAYSAQNRKIESGYKFEREACYDE